MRPSWTSLFFFFNDTATTEIYTLSLHDALPIFGIVETAAAFTDIHSDLAMVLCDREHARDRRPDVVCFPWRGSESVAECLDRKSTRLNSSHQIISYAVFCLKKKKTKSRATRSDP